MASITINIPDRQFQKIQELAQELSISPEELLRISLEEWLSHPQNDFSQAANYVLQKNADLYRRLA
ncbi:MAG: DNA-binding protein [Cyanobacteria bacterium J06639_18]